MVEEANSRVCKVFERSRSNPDAMTIEATVDTGFERLAMEELVEKIYMIHREDYTYSPGRIFFNTGRRNFVRVNAMRSVDNLAIVIFSEIYHFPAVKSQCLEYFEKLAWGLEFEQFLQTWAEEVEFYGELFPMSSDNIEEPPLSFRVTAHRSYTHAFGSMEAAAKFGGILNDRYGWRVDMTGFDLEVLLYIVNDRVTVALKTTKRSKHHRSIIEFGPTTLRATICYNLLRLAKIKSGDIVIDPLCGGGSIPIECALAFDWPIILCGDNNEKAVQRTNLNVAYLHLDQRITPTLWDATNLPLATGFVDAIVTDMPFGKRSGNKSDNRILYTNLILEFSRIARPDVTRMVLLTNDRRSLIKALGNLKQPYWNIAQIIAIKLGGLKPAVFVLKRNANKFKKPENCSKQAENAMD